MAEKQDDTRSITSSLLARAQSQDEAAWQRLVVLFGPTVQHWFRRQGVPRADVGDLAQDVFLRVWKSLSGFRRVAAGDTFRGWLYTIARNVAADHFGKQRPANAAESWLAQLPEQLDEDALLAEQREMLARLLELVRGDFQPHTVQAFERCVLEGQETVRVAADLGMKESAVRESRRRVKQRLCAEYRELYGSDPWTLLREARPEEG